MIRETIRWGKQTVDVEQEIEIPSVDGCKTVIPVNTAWKNILIQVSGGLDSALLLFLTAKTLKDQKATTKITPLSLEIPNKVKTLASARKVIEAIKKETGYPYLSTGIEVIMPPEEATLDRKNKFFSTTVADLVEKEKIDFEFNGNTKNPPESVRKNFRDDEARERLRDDRKTIYNGCYSASPHSFNDKKGIVYLYKKHGILESVAKHTLSCDINLDEVYYRNLPTPCNECWWCRERAWGFEANGLKDPAIQP